MSNDSELHINLHAHDEASEIIEDVRDSVEEATDAIEETGEQSKRSTESITKYWKEVTVAMGIAGVGIEANAREQHLLSQTTQNLAASLGVTDDEIRKVGLDVLDTGDSVDYALAIMEQGRKQGLDSAEALGEYYVVWDNVADATGENAEQLAKAGAALQSVGIDASNTEEAYSAFGFITRETSGTVGEFLQFVQRSGPYIREMGMDIDDTAAVMGALEKEFGYTSRVARTEFQQAVNEVDREMQGAIGTINNLRTEQQKLEEKYASGGISADDYRIKSTELSNQISTAQSIIDNYGDTQTVLYEKLGLTTEQVGKYKQMVEDSSGVIMEQSDIQGETYTITQKLTWEIEKLRYKYGDLGTALGNIVPILTSIGPIMGVIQGAKKIHTVLTGAETVATWGLVSAQIALLAPYIAIAAAIAALVVVGWYLYENWDDVVEMVMNLWDGLVSFFTGLWDTISGIFSGVIKFITDLFFPPTGSLTDQIQDVWGGIKDFFHGIWDSIIGIFGDSWTTVMGILFPPIGIAKLIYDNWDAIKEFFGNVWDKIVDIFSTSWDYLIDLLNWDSIFESIHNVWNTVVGFFKTIWDSITGIFDIGWDTILKIIFPAYGIADMVWNNWGQITNAIEWIWESVKWIFSSFFYDARSAGIDIVMGLWDGIWSLAGWIWDNTRSFAEGIFNSIQSGLSTLWPFSPSEAGIDIGEGLSLGIAKGIEDTSTIIQHATKSLRDDLLFDSNEVIPPRTSSMDRMKFGLSTGRYFGSSGNFGMDRGHEHQPSTIIKGNTFVIREEADITKIARELERIRVTKIRSRGIQELQRW